MIGTRVADRYDIEEQIGIGGMGIVYRAYDTRLTRHVALKVIAPHLVQHEAARSQFLREAQALAGLMHPNIVTVFDLSEDAATSTVFIVMELLRGRSLRHCMSDTERPLFSHVALPLCRALEAAHNQGILHRDIKPENVFVCADGTIKLMDFGLARLLTANSRSQASLVAGTLAYMAPEQLTGAKTDFRADLYSLGILFYEYLCGVAPFEADNAGAILMKHLTEAPAPLRRHVPALSPELEAVVLRLLEKEPDARFESATALRETLERPTSAGPLPLLTTADASVPESRNHAMPPLAGAVTLETPTPVLPPPVAPPRANLARSNPLRRGVKPALLAGGAACFGAAALLFVGPVHRRVAPTGSADPVAPVQKARLPLAASRSDASAFGSLVQQARPAPVAAPAPPTHSVEQKQIELSQAHASAELDVLIKQQEQTRAEVERLEKLVADTEAKRRIADMRAASAPTRPSPGSLPPVTGPKIPPRQVTPAGPLLPDVPSALVQIAALHPHDPFEFRTRPVMRGADGTLQVQVHNSQACYLYFYALQEHRSLASLVSNGERRLAGTPQHDVYTDIGIHLEDSTLEPAKLLLLASVKPLLGLPAHFALPAAPRHSPADVSIDRRFALLHDYRDQIVSTMQTNRVQFDGKNVRQDDLIVRFLRVKPAPAGAPALPRPPMPSKSA